MQDPHVPTFANAGWAPFSRQAAIAIALREWRLFGSPVDDVPPGTRPAPVPDQKPEREDGLWQRVGEYWWEALPPDSRESAWTGKHGADAAIFDPAVDGRYAWSAAFISYVMRIAGAGARFPYSASHSTYINAAAAGAAPALRARAPTDYAPVPGDLICHFRGGASVLRFADLPTAGPFTSHCDIVVQEGAAQLTVIGGNVDDSVTEKHVPLTQDGRLSAPDGSPSDPRYDWAVVIEILYDEPLTPTG